MLPSLGSSVSVVYQYMKSFFVSVEEVCKADESNDEEDYVVVPLNAGKFRPVVIIHGLNDGAKTMTDLKDFITKHHPGTEVHIPALYEHKYSYENMWVQVAAFGEAIKKISDSSPNGINIIGYSQGGLIGRAIIQTVADLNVHSFVALSSPLNGQYGDTSVVDRFLPSTTRALAYEFFYHLPLRYALSFANYWRDPYHLDMYATSCEFLAPLNDESTNAPNGHAFQPEWRENFLKLSNLVLIGGEDDGVITPWQSALFGCYGDDLSILNMRDQEIYDEDVFGLKTLDEAGKIHEFMFSDVEHTTWHGNEDVFVTAIKPYLQ